MFSKLLLLCWVSDQVIECAGPFRAKSQFPIIRWLSWSQALLIIKSSVLSSAVFKDRYNGGSSFWCSSPGLGEPMWVLIPSLLKGEDLHACDIPSSCESPCRAFGSWLSLPFYSFQYGLFFFLNVIAFGRIHSASVQVVFSVRCTTWSHCLSVSVGGGEPRSFLLCHLPVSSSCGVFF